MGIGHHRPLDEEEAVEEALAEAEPGGRLNPAG
jgi:hypothetical protein